VDNVCVSGSKNVFDLGDQISGPSFGPVVIRDSSCGFTFTGHFMAAHGAGGGIIVTNNQLNAGGTGIIFDTSDVNYRSAGSIGNTSWLNNRFEQPSFGMFLFIGIPSPTPSPPQPGLQDTQWKGNIYDGCVFACYFFAAEDGALPGTPSPNFGHITMADRSATSKYDAVDLSGGFYGLGNGGIEGIQIGGPSLYTGSSGGTASSILMLRGSPSPSGGTVYITYAGGVAATYNVSTNETTTAVAAGLASSIASAFASATAVTLGNANYGVIGMALSAAQPPGSYAASPYTVIINAPGLSVVGVPSVMCTVPPSGGSVPCYSGAFDNGDGVAFRNAAHDVDISNARVISPGELQSIFGRKAATIFGSSPMCWAKTSKQLRIRACELNRRQVVRLTTTSLETIWSARPRVSII
jgi:hypothetical protein